MKKKVKNRRLAIQSSTYPEDYNRENPMLNFNSWANYIHQSVRNTEGVSNPKPVSEIATDILREISMRRKEIAMNSLLTQAKAIIHR